MTYTPAYILSLAAALLLLVPMAVLAAPAQSTASDSIKGQLLAQAHRNAVTVFVESTRSGTDTKVVKTAFTAQVQGIALSQKNSEAVATDAIEKLASRSGVNRFFFGTDEESLTLLQNNMLQTEKDIEQLTAISASLGNGAEGTALTTQITALEEDYQNIQSFVVAQDTTESWFRHFFTSSPATVALR